MVCNSHFAPLLCTHATECAPRNAVQRRRGHAVPGGTDSERKRTGLAVLTCAPIHAVLVDDRGTVPAAGDGEFGPRASLLALGGPAIGGLRQDDGERRECG